METWIERAYNLLNLKVNCQIKSANQEEFKKFIVNLGTSEIDKFLGIFRQKNMGHLKEWELLPIFTKLNGNNQNSAFHVASEHDVTIDFYTQIASPDLSASVSETTE
jgi:hypothetical protein